MKNDIINKILFFARKKDVVIYEYKDFYTMAYKDGECKVFDKNGFPKLMNFSELDPNKCKNPKLVYK